MLYTFQRRLAGVPAFEPVMEGVICVHRNSEAVERLGVQPGSKKPVPMVWEEGPVFNSFAGE